MSSLHAVEHFGLGRYGDPIDPNACFQAMKSLQRVIRKNGILYFSVPVGRENAVYFNAHRMFTPQKVLEVFGDMELLEFSYIHNYEVKTLVGERAKKMIRSNTVAVENYDCGIFIFCKK